ncbi:hypothetical protein HB364_03660 [Pseudoflavitalea sp. X16]|uniref:clostripain-related cysteine peptidase n=1 Tax=Paraflavitalea devenefica TaxID=2716334 RepID=UPI00142305F8|nr:clostripain-related cysteine peptidase [Paraflavitalea devenefica]NII24157.1 hypothetical protein [Paraflavitalea devenefica]
MSNVKWTVSIIAQFQDGHKQAFEELLNAIKDQTDTSTVNYYIFKYYHEEKLADILTATPDQQGKLQIVQQPRVDANDFHTEGTCLTDFFSSCSLKTDSDRHILITWGHGAGFGFFSEGTLRDNDIPPGMVRHTNLMHSSGIIQMGFDTINENFTRHLNRNNLFLNNFSANAVQESFKVLTVKVLNDLIGKTFGSAGKKIDLFYSMNCYMQMLETGYFLSENVNYLAGSENFQFFFGPDYNKLFKKLHQDTPADPLSMETLSTSIVNDFDLRYKDPVIRRQFIDIYQTPLQAFDTASLSINNLQQYEQVNTKINTIATYFIDHKSKELYNLIRAARLKCRKVSGPTFGIIDMIHFCKSLLPLAAGKQELIDKLNDLINFVTNTKEVVVAKLHPPILCVPTAGDSICPQGFSIFFPNSRRESVADQFIRLFMDTFYLPEREAGVTNRFLDNSTWDEFIDTYYHFPFII